MDRKEIEQEYDVQNGVIRTPGQFEGEAVYVPYFWEVYLDGCADADDGNVISFDITPEDREEFPELANRWTVKLYQRSDGFVCEA